MVKDTTQDGRAGPGSNLSLHMAQDVLVLHPSKTSLNLAWSGMHPVRYFAPVGTGKVHDDTATDGGGFYLTDADTPVNKYQKPLLQLEFLLRVCHQGGWVVDLCCGSGSGVIAALRLGFCAAGFDIQDTQVDATRRRIAKFVEMEAAAHEQRQQKKSASQENTAAVQITPENLPEGSPQGSLQSSAAEELDDSANVSQEGSPQSSAAEMVDDSANVSPEGSPQVSVDDIFGEY